jgi:peptidyl-prolyl cis-trans isomerase D
MSREANKIAKIDRTVVSMEQYSRAYTDTLKEYQRQYRQAVTPEFIEALNLKQKVLDDLIDQYIIEADAKKMGIVLKDEDLRNFISRVDIFQRNGAFDEGLYRRYWRPRDDAGPVRGQGAQELPQEGTRLRHHRERDRNG